MKSFTDKKIFCPDTIYSLLITLRFVYMTCYTNLLLAEPGFFLLQHNFPFRKQTRTTGAPTTTTPPDAAPMPIATVLLDSLSEKQQTRHEL